MALPAPQRATPQFFYYPKVRIRPLWRSVWMSAGIVAMLGASPGASTSVFIMLEVIKKCFAGKLTPSGWLPKLTQMIPSYGQSLTDNIELYKKVRADTAATLRINP